MISWRREGSWLFAATLVQQVVGVLVLLWLARQIAVEDWGRFALDAAALGLLGAFGTAKLNVLAVRLSDDEWNSGLGPRLMGAVRTESVLLFVLGLGLLHLLDRLTAPTLMLALGLTLRHAAQQSRVLSERVGRYAGLAQVETIALLTGHGVAVATVLAGRPAAALYMREGFTGLALLVLILSDLRRAGLLTLAPWFVRPREWFGFVVRSRPAYLDSVAEQFIDRVVVLLAGSCGGEFGAGIFAQARGLAYRPHQMLAPLANRFALGWLSRKSSAQERRDAVFAIARRLALPALACGALTIALGPWLVPFVLGPEWSAAGATVVWLAGFVATITLLELAKTALHVDAQLGALALVRGAQLLAFLVTFVAWQQTSGDPVQGLALGVSVGTIAALAVAYKAVDRGPA